MADCNPTRHGWRFNDITRQTFGRLIVLLYAGYFRWLCQCECGNLTVVIGRDLRSGHTRSCGCLNSEITTRRNTRHSHKHRKKPTKIYRAWSGIKARCFNPKIRNYKRYGGRGITVCAAWKNSFENFFADIGEPPSATHSIDRIDNDGNYSCGHCEQCITNGWLANCRWATLKEQNRNRSINHLITIGNKSLTLAEWAECSGVRSTTIISRLNSNWPPEKAIFTPLR